MALQPARADKAGIFFAAGATKQEIHQRGNHDARQPEKSADDPQIAHAREFEMQRAQGQCRKRCRAAGESISKSNIVRKSMVLNFRSSAGGAQIFAPRDK